MMYPLVLDLAADPAPATVTCRVLGFSTQAFYKRHKSAVSQRDCDDAHLINAVRDIHADNPAFGYRFISDQLPGRGIAAGENIVAWSYSRERIWSVFAKKPSLNKRRSTGPRRTRRPPTHTRPTRCGSPTYSNTVPLWCSVMSLTTTDLVPYVNIRSTRSVAVGVSCRGGGRRLPGSPSISVRAISCSTWL
jgi:hypothetical protein